MTLDILDLILHYQCILFGTERRIETGVRQSMLSSTIAFVVQELPLSIFFLFDVATNLSTVKRGAGRIGGASFREPSGYT